MSYLLNVVYLALLTIFSPWLLFSAVRKGKYRQGWAAKLLGSVPLREGSQKCLWLHAVSVGEVNLLATLLDRIKRHYPQWQCVISTTTKTGYDLARKKYAGYTVFYCPLDFSWAVKRAVRRIRPDMLVLAELELWPNLIRAVRRSGAQVAIVNGRLSENSFRGYRRLRWLFARLLRRIDTIAVQNDTYAERFLALGASREAVTVTGSLKFDGAQTDRNNPATRQLSGLAGIAPTDVVFLAGSTQAGEEEIALATYLQLRQEHPQLRLILVPRHPERFDEVAAVLDQSGVAWQRRSELANDNSAPGEASPRVLLVDAVGELGAWWGTAQIAYVGGSMGSRGGQNMIEPAAYAAAVSFGPNTRNFRDIVELMLANNAALVVRDGEELAAFVQRCLSEPSYAAGLGERARRLVSQQLGAADRTLQLLAEDSAVRRAA